jgi:5-methylcytosine-specific restriction protein A
MMGLLTKNGFIPQWKLDGKRRPLPGIYEATQKYGVENVYFNKPRYTPEGMCPYCGKPVNNKRRTYCCKECSHWYSNVTVWYRGRGAYSTQMLYRDNFTCQDCGEFHAYKNKHGIYLPASDGQLEVHHILPVSCGGGDEPTNLITLCKACHIKRHEKIRDEFDGKENDNGN